MGICVSCRRRERKAPEKRSVPGAGAPGKGAAAAELLPRRADRLPTMANSMSNIKMTNPIKGFVSKRRRRYQKDGFNLDLAYITDRLIAMGFPAEKLEGVYRNHIDEVYRFLEKMHKDRYMIYNLCSERSYDVTKFHDRVKKYAFEDHMPPDIEIIKPFCEDVHEWLSADPKNVAAVHCKAGKGRTGTMVCCYLLHSGQKQTADDALKFYGTKRTHDEKGVTIPSQRRYVEYYAALLHSGLPYAPCKVHVRELIMSPACALAAAACSPELSITQAKPPLKTPAGCQEVKRSASSISVQLTHCTPLCGDVRVDVYNKHKMKMRKEKLFHFWFNTFFVTAELGACRVPPPHDSPNLETFKLTLNKWQLDDAHKDKQHKHYSQDFKVELIIQKMPESSTFSGAAHRVPSPPPSSSASSSSEPDTEPDEHWDSGEHPRRPAQPYRPDHISCHCKLKPMCYNCTRFGHTYNTCTSIDEKSKHACCDCKVEPMCYNCSRYGHTNDTYDSVDSKHALLSDSLDGRPDPTSNLDKSTTLESRDTKERHRTKCCRYYNVHSNVEYESSGNTDYTKPLRGVISTPGADLDRNSDHYKDWSRVNSCTDSQCWHSLSLSTPDDESLPDSFDKDDKSKPFYASSATESDPFFLTPNSTESDSFLLQDSKPDGFFLPSDPTDTPDTYYKLSSESKKTEASDGFYKLSTNGKKSEGITRTRLSLGDVRASWREFSGKFSDSRKKKEES